MQDSVDNEQEATRHIKAARARLFGEKGKGVQLLSAAVAPTLYLVTATAEANWY